MDADYLVNRNAILLIEHNVSADADTKPDSPNLTSNQPVFGNAS